MAFVHSPTRLWPLDPLEVHLRQSFPRFTAHKSFPLNDLVSVMCALVLCHIGTLEDQAVTSSASPPSMIICGRRTQCPKKSVTKFV